jgi:HEAT repeat protein
MPRHHSRIWTPLILTLLVPGFLPAADTAQNTRKDEKPALVEKVAAAAQKIAQEVLAQFDKGDPGWKVRLESLIRLVKAGPAVAPVLAAALKDGSPTTREFAAQALVLFADPRTRPELEHAVADPKSGVRIYAIQALSMLGPLTATEKHRQIATNDPSRYGVREMMVAALARDDKPSSTALQQALADFNLANVDTARLGELAPDFLLTDFTGKTYRLSQFRGKQTVVLRFLLFDY